jgi:hypothetical protein
MIKKVVYTTKKNLFQKILVILISIKTLGFRQIYKYTIL